MELQYCNWIDGVGLIWFCRLLLENLYGLKFSFYKTSAFIYIMNILTIIFLHVVFFTIHDIVLLYCLQV